MKKQCNAMKDNISQMESQIQKRKQQKKTNFLKIQTFKQNLIQQKKKYVDLTNTLNNLKSVIDYQNQFKRKIQQIQRISHEKRMKKLNTFNLNAQNSISKRYKKSKSVHQFYIQCQKIEQLKDQIKKYQKRCTKSTSSANLQQLLKQKHPQVNKKQKGFKNKRNLQQKSPNIKINTFQQHILWQNQQLISLNKYNCDSKPFNFINKSLNLPILHKPRLKSLSKDHIQRLTLQHINNEQNIVDLICQTKINNKFKQISKQKQKFLKLNSIDILNLIKQNNKLNQFIKIVQMEKILYVSRYEEEKRNSLIKNQNKRKLIL